MYKVGTALKLNFGEGFHYGMADELGNVFHKSKKHLLGLLVIVILLLPALSMASEKFPIENCVEGNDLGVAIDFTNASARVDRSYFKDGEITKSMPFSTKGSTIIFKLPDDAATVTITESERKTRITDEFEKIKHAAQPLPLIPKIVGQPEHTFKCVRFVQSYEKSRLMVQVVSPKQDNDETTTEKTYIAGAKEHWYFSADLPVTSVQQLKFDAKTSQYVEQDVPATFYVGLNYQIGDIYKNPSDFDMQLNRMALKFMAKATAPAESYGFGISYDVGQAVIFVARLVTMNDLSASSAGNRGTYSTIYGISFNIERGIGWLPSK